MKPPITVTIGWYHVTESNWYPDRWTEGMQRATNWRAAVHITGDTAGLRSLTTKGVSAVFDWTAGLVKWQRIQHVDRLEVTASGILIWIPSIVEPDDALFTCTLSDGSQQWQVEAFVPECPAHLSTDTMECQIGWHDGQAHLDIVLQEPCTVTWHYQIDGLWYSNEIALLTSYGHSRLPLDVPYADTVNLEVKTTHGAPACVHRWQVVGRAGVASGRYLWYRGALYAPKLSRLLPWVSVIVPVYHPDDIDRVPGFVRWHQIEWWVHPGEWTEEAIIQLQTKFPGSSVVRLGVFGDDQADVQVLRPIEVQGEMLDPQRRYSVQLFDDAGDTDFARRSGWLIDRLMRPDMRGLRFVELSWRQSLAHQSPTGNAKQYGLAFSFVRPPADEYMWSTAQRDMDWREHRESMPCRKCEHKAACRQSLPMPYETDGEHNLPWISPADGKCPLPAWFAIAPNVTG